MALRIDNRSIPAARQYNAAKNTILWMGRTLQAAGGGRTPPALNKILVKHHCYKEADWAIYADINNPIYGGWGWNKKKGVVPILSCPYGLVWQGYNLHNARQYDQHFSGSKPAMVGYGTWDTFKQTAQDWFLNPADNLLGAITGVRYNGSTYDSGTFFYSGDDLLFAGGTLDPVVLPWYHGKGLNHNGIQQTWITRGSGASPSAYIESQGGWVNYFADWYVADTGGGTKGTQIAGPLWQMPAGGGDNGQFNDAPFASWGIELSGSTAIIGGLGRGGETINPITSEPMWSHWSPSSCLYVPASCFAGFGVPNLLRSCPDGTIFKNCKLEIKVDNLELYQSTVTTTVDSTGQQTTTGEAQTTELAATYMLVGGWISDPAEGTMSWDIIGQVGAGNGSSDKYQVIDATNLCNLFVNNIRRSKYFVFAICPGIFNPSYLGMGTTRSYLNSIMPSISLATWVDPYNNTAHWGAGDFVYNSSSSGSQLTCTGVELGNIYMEWTYPDSEKLNKKAEYVNRPTMGNPIIN